MIISGKLVDIEDERHILDALYGGGLPGDGHPGSRQLSDGYSGSGYQEVDIQVGDLKVVKVVAGSIVALSQNPKFFLTIVKLNVDVSKKIRLK